MGGGRTSHFPGTKGADSYQETLLPEPIKSRRRGKRHAFSDGPSGGISGGATATPTGKATAKPLLILPADVLVQCQRYRFGIISEPELVSWLQRVLIPAKCKVRPPALRTLIQNGIAQLQNTKDASGICRQPEFRAILRQFETRFERLIR